MHRSGHLRAGANRLPPEVAMLSSLLGLLVLIADIWAILEIIKGKGDTGKKILWIVLILFLPVVGFILWYLLGRKG